MLMHLMQYCSTVVAIGMLYMSSTCSLPVDERTATMIESEKQFPFVLQAPSIL